MFDAAGQARNRRRGFCSKTIQSLEPGQLLQYQLAAERLLLELGITFNVYGDSAGTERIFPFRLDSAHSPRGRVDSRSNADSNSAFTH